MSIYQISPYALEKDFVEFFEKVGRHIDVITQCLVGTELTLPNNPKRYGPHIAPYAFAGKVMLLLDFARGRQNLSREFVDSALHDYSVLLGASAFGKEPAAVNWEEHKDSPIARVLLASQARLKLNENAHISQGELFALTGFSTERASAQGLVSAQGDVGELLFEPDGVRGILAIIAD